MTWGEGHSSHMGPVWADPTALPGEASAFPRALRILSCTSSTGRECQCHQAVRRLIELCTQVDWNFFSQQFRMREPGTGRTSVIPEIWGCVNHNQHSAEIRISLKGFLLSAVLNQFRLRFAQTPAQETTDPSKDAACSRCSRRQPSPRRARTCALHPCTPLSAPWSGAHSPAARAATGRRARPRSER